MEKELPTAIKNSHEPIRNSNDSDVITVGKLFAELFKKGELTKDIIENKAKEINSDTHDLILTVLGFCDLDEEYLVYKKEKEGLMSKGEIAFSFLEQFRHEPEIIPAEIEKEPEIEVVEILPESQEPEKEPTSEPTTPQEAKIPEAPRKPEIPSPEPIPPAKTTVQPPENLPIVGTLETIPNPGRRRWQEVKRETEVMAVEDLSGDMQTFEKHVKALGVAKKDAAGNWQWTGGDKKLVFLGDILGDRNMHGGEIAFIIGNLAEQAEKEGGQVDFLCGNHDMAFLHYLCSSGARVDDERVVRTLTNQYRGIWELAYFDPDQDSELKKTNPFSADFGSHAKELWNKLFEKIPKILEATRNDPVGRYFLEKLCQIKVAVIHDDTLLCHTDPTTAMIADLTKDGNITQRVAEVNKIFQENLRKSLFDGKRLSGEFREIEKIYLDTDNRAHFVEEETSMFGKVTFDLLKKVAENLYKGRKIKGLEQFFNKHGIENHDWFLTWRINLLGNSSYLEIDKAIVEESIKGWKKDNGIKGEYFGEMFDILNAFKSKNKQKLEKAEKMLLEKIRGLNQKGDNIEKVKNSGINAIIHGHSPHYDIFYDEKDLIIVSPHGSFSGVGDSQGGVSTIQKNGRIDLIGKTFRK